VVSLKQNRGQSIFILYDLLPPHGCPPQGGIMAKRGYVPKQMLEKERCLECGKLWTKAMLIDYKLYTCIRCYNRRLYGKKSKSH
jgi:DNA-directed RNA polymerase subunit RPC12/RpoP